ncbi:MAG TPA: pitrilysin family protein [Caulobacteraceae bacterium]|nr:pitrilysin family protein [Caulobacteraceae bacterium]
MAAATPRVHRLANGVSVICEPMTGLESFALSVVAGRGARQEPPERSGWSHLLEHMVFKGAGGRSAREIVEAIELKGGQINAATGYERTSFQIRALRGGLELGLRTCADLILHPTLDAAELEREKQVVGQEIAESEDTPDDHVFELAQAAAFKGQPLGRPILGEVPTVEAAGSASLEAWREGLYAPDRLVVSASGAVEEDELLALAEDAFGAAGGTALADPEPARFQGGLAPQRRRLEQAHLVFLLPGPGARDAHYYVARVFAEILGGGMSSRLFQEAREKRGLAYSIDAWAESYADVGAIGVYAGAGAEHATPLAEVVAAEIKGVVEHVSDEELARAKAQLTARLLMARESPLVRAEQAAGQMLLFGRLFSARQIAEGVEAVSAADVRALGEALMEPAACVGAALGPARAMAAPEKFRKALFN